MAYNGTQWVQKAQLVTHVVCILYRYLGLLGYILFELSLGNCIMSSIIEFYYQQYEIVHKLPRNLYLTI